MAVNRFKLLPMNTLYRLGVHMLKVILKSGVGSD